jgi:hypothetical protein
VVFGETRAHVSYLGKRNWEIAVSDMAFKCLVERRKSVLVRERVKTEH